MSGLVRVRIGGVEKNVSAGFAKKHKLQILDEPATHRGGQPRRTTLAGGRPVGGVSKRRTSVDAEATAPAASNEETPQVPAEGAVTPEEAPQ